MDLNNTELEFSDLVFAYQSWVMAVINDEKSESQEKFVTEEVIDDAMTSMRFLPAEVVNAIETTLARVYAIDSEELSNLLFPED